jgi:hypothetical protein
MEYVLNRAITVYYSSNRASYSMPMNKLSGYSVNLPPAVVELNGNQDDTLKHLAIKHLD